MFLTLQLNADHFYVTRESLDLLLQFVTELRYREPQVIELKIIFPKSFKHSTLYYRGGVVVKALRYKPAGRGFDSRWCQDFSS